MYRHQILIDIFFLFSRNEDLRRMPRSHAKKTGAEISTLKAKADVKR